MGDGTLDAVGQHPEEFPIDRLAPDLGADDHAALEALVECGMDCERVAEPLRARARAVLSVMNLLGVSDAAQGAASSDALIELTLARLNRSTLTRDSVDAARLSPMDEDALEALVGAEFEPFRVAPVLRPRATHQAAVLGMLDVPRAELARGRSELVRRTLDRVQSDIDQSQAPLKFESAELTRPRFRLTDLVTVAALLAIASAAIGPMVGAIRDQARRTTCQAGLLSAARGMAQYASDFSEAMPMASASIAGNSWWNVGTPDKSNSANLFRTISTGYNRVDDLACAGNPHACTSDLGRNASDWRTLGEVSYSYQNMFAKERPSWISDNRRVVVVDGSPVVRWAIQKQMINPLANSMNHGGKGQNALFTDGSVQWLNSPVLASGDNIWLPRSIEQAIAHLRNQARAEPIQGVETPSGKDDAFLVP